MIDISAVGSVPLHQIKAKSYTNGHLQLPFPHTAPPPPLLTTQDEMASPTTACRLEQNNSKIRTTKTTKTKTKDTKNN